MKLHVFETDADIERRLSQRRHSARILARDDEKLARMVEEELAKPRPKQTEPEVVTA